MLWPPGHAEPPPLSLSPTRVAWFLEKSIVNFRLHTWCCTFYVFRQTQDYMCLSLDSYLEYLHWPKNLCSAYSFFPSSMPLLGSVFQNIIQLKPPSTYSLQITSLTSVHIGSYLMYFCGLIAHFFLVLNNILLSGKNMVYSFTYWAYSWLLPSYGNYLSSC